MISERDNLEKDIKEFIKESLNEIEEKKKLEHFSLEISNHNGNLQMDYTIRKRSY